MQNNERYSEPLQAREDEYPLGSIVFYCGIDQYLKSYRGITHVGIVVGYEDGSPQIAHACNSGGKNHVLISRLKAFLGNGEPMHYITAKPPEGVNVGLIVSLAASMATTKEKPKVIVKFSDRRRDNMESNLTKDFLDINAKFTQDIYTKTMESNISRCHNDFFAGRKLAGCFTSLAKTLNIIKSDLFDPIKENASSEIQFNKSMLARLENERKVVFPGNQLTHKGYHCVQFVVMVYQMEFLLSNSNIRTNFLWSNLEKGISNNSYFSRKNKEGLWPGVETSPLIEGSSNGKKGRRCKKAPLKQEINSRKKNKEGLWQGFERAHPIEVISEGKVGEFKDDFLRCLIPLDGKMLSPAGLLHLLGGGGPPGPGGYGISAKWDFSSSMGKDSIAQLSNSISYFECKINDATRQFSLILNKRCIATINSLLGLFAIKNVVERLCVNDIALSLRSVFSRLRCRNQMLVGFMVHVSGSALTSAQLSIVRRGIELAAVGVEEERPRKKAKKSSVVSRSR
ncbi:MAG: hypothetical protein HON78_03660 [Legionellales bacterium]|jgi:hypothetical protein|nr:hypothetical protein [Legionellales bacterium]